MNKYTYLINKKAYLFDKVVYLLNPTRIYFHHLRPFHLCNPQNELPRKARVDPLASLQTPSNHLVRCI